MTKGRRRIDAARLADRAGRAANGFAPPAARTRGASPGKGEGQRPRRGRNGRRGLFRIPRSFNPPAARTRGAPPGKGEGRHGRNGRDGPVPDTAIISVRPAMRMGAVTTRQRRRAAPAARPEREGWPILNPPAFQPARGGGPARPPLAARIFAGGKKHSAPPHLQWSGDASVLGRRR